MNVFVTGNQGYIGSVLTRILHDKGYGVTGYDTGYYEGCELYDDPRPHKQVVKDIRDVSRGDLRGVDAVVHLAALSNDPLGELEPGVTEAINYEATLKLGALAKESGVKRFVYASSQSMYGIADTESEVEEDANEKNPLTAYARTKWNAEVALQKLSSDDFAVVSMRPSTVFGVSPRLRCDIVFNNLVACAYTTGRIEVKSDGAPWRPVVHVQDVIQAFIAGLEAPAALVAGESFNVGIPNGNFTIRNLAEAASRAVKGSTVAYTGEHGRDARTYRVAFKKILTTLKDYYKPTWSLDRGAAELVDLFREVKFTEEQFRGRMCNRLPQIRHLLQEGLVDKNLRWVQ